MQACCARRAGCACAAMARAGRGPWALRGMHVLAALLLASPRSGTRSGSLATAAAIPYRSKLDAFAREAPVAMGPETSTAMGGDDDDVADTDDDARPDSWVLADVFLADSLDPSVHSLKPHQKEDVKNCHFEVRHISAQARQFHAFKSAIREAKVQHCTRVARKTVEKFVMFVGYQRSGHTLTGALMDAHPSMIIAQEFDVLKFLHHHDHGLALLHEGLCRNSIACADTARHQTGYSYRVPHGLQGAFSVDGLKVLGDKQGGRNGRLLAEDPGRAHRQLGKLRESLGMPLHFLHVIRNPWDNIATMIVHRAQKHPVTACSAFPCTLPKGSPRYRLAELCIDEYFGSMDAIVGFRRDKAHSGTDAFLRLYSEDLIADPEAELRKICAYLGLPSAQRYLDACREVVMTKPSESRRKLIWPEPIKSAIRSRWAAHADLLGRYQHLGPD